MIMLDIEQGSEEWIQARLGIPTASEFSKIVTTKGLKSAQSNDYMNKLLAEWLLNAPVSSYTNDWMERGHEVEDEARQFYSFTQDTEVKQVGIVYKDERKLIASSPDGLPNDGGLELKCPAPGTHVKYLLGGKLPTEYVIQVQGNLYVTGREWWDFMSYYPGLQPFIIRAYRDEELIKKMDSYLNKFVDEMLEKRERLNAA